MTQWLKTGEASNIQSPPKISPPPPGLRANHSRQRLVVSSERAATSSNIDALSEEVLAKSPGLFPDEWKLLVGHGKCVAWCGWSRKLHKDLVANVAQGCLLIQNVLFKYLIPTSGKQNGTHLNGMSSRLIIAILWQYDSTIFISRKKTLELTVRPIQIYHLYSTYSKPIHSKNQDPMTPRINQPHWPCKAATWYCPRGSNRPPVIHTVWQQKYCWWKKYGDHQLRLVAYPIIFRVLYIPGG